MNKPYAPPYTLNSAIVHCVAEICEALGRMASAFDANSLKLRRINRIHTIHGSQAIEGNTLSVAQIAAILDGKHVIAPPREIQEVRNAIKAYDRLMPIAGPNPTVTPWCATSETDLLEAHEVLMSGLLDAPGRYRDSGVGVMSGMPVLKQ